MPVSGSPMAPGREPSPPSPTPRPRSPLVVVAGAASRDLVADDRRGWRLGGGAVYGALALACLGLRVVAVLGLDEAAAEAEELASLAAAGCEIRVVRLDHGAVFENVETAAGRRQRCRSWPDPIQPEAVEPGLATAADGWLLAPIGNELPAAWARLPRPEAVVALSWQGLLRRSAGGDRVARRRPRPGPLLGRADLVAASVEDLGPRFAFEAAATLLRPTATLAVTAADRGGLVGERVGDAWRWRRYRAVPSRGVVDPTGAGDVFLAVLLATRLVPQLVGGRLAGGGDVLLAAAAASLAVEGPGVAAVPDRRAIAERLQGLARAKPAEAR